METEELIEHTNELEERELIRKQISTMSFEDLQSLKEKIGSKEYNSVVFGTQKNIKKPTTFKRENKNRPRERSSKVRVKTDIVFKKVAPRDPRFDPLCGTYQEKLFKTNYSFVNDIKQRELVQLRKDLKKEKSPEQIAKIKLLIQRIENQNRELKKQDVKKSENEQEKQAIHKKLKQGQKPVFLKKSEKQIQHLVRKYEDLKKSNKLEKHLEKRYKKLASKDKKNFS